MKKTLLVIIFILLYMNYCKFTVTAEETVYSEYEMFKEIVVNDYNHAIYRYQNKEAICYLSEHRYPGMTSMWCIKK